MTQNNAVTMKKKNLKSIFVIIGLIAAFVAVIYAMRYTQTWEFRRGLEVLFGSPPPVEAPRKWTWCPEITGQIEFHTSRASEDSVTPEEICNVTLEPVPEEKAKRKFKRYLTVGTGESAKTLEADEKLEVFQVDGLIFQSKALSQILRGR